MGADMRKGVSPLIASVLLVTFTIALGSLILGFFTGTTNKLAEDTEKGRQETAECTYKSAKISDIFINTSGTFQTIRASVTNDGNGNLTLRSAAVYDTAGNKCPFNAGGNVLEPGDTKLYTNSTDCTIFSSQCTDFAYAEVTTTCGNAFDTFKTKPTCTS